MYISNRLCQIQRDVSGSSYQHWLNNQNFYYFRDIFIKKAIYSSKKRTCQNVSIEVPFFSFFIILHFLETIDELKSQESTARRQAPVHLIIPNYLNYGQQVLHIKQSSPSISCCIDRRMGVNKMSEIFFCCVLVFFRISIFF